MTQQTWRQRRLTGKWFLFQIVGDILAEEVAVVDPTVTVSEAYQSRAEAYEEEKKWALAHRALETTFGCEWTTKV